MRRLASQALAALVTVACASGQPSLSPVDEQLIASLGFDRDMMVAIRSSGTSFERLTGPTEDDDSAPAAGIVLVTRSGQGRDALRAVRSALDGSGYSAYLNDQAFGHGPDKIAVMKTTNPYDYLAVVRTDGINYDLEHAQVLARYREWADRFGLSLVGAGQDWLEAEFSSQPSDWLAVAREVYEFCPDVVEQGTNDVETLAQEMRSTNTLYLWWD
jgi:hypothetical protein